MIVKVCGMRQAGNILRVAALGVDWIGFIFWEKSKRYLGEEEGERARETTREASFGRVGVFVNAAIEEMTAKASLYRLDYLQLHGDESPGLCRSLRREGLPLIKAFSVATQEDLRKTVPYEGLTDYFLFDAPCAGYGGSGKSFDWSVLEAYEGRTPFLLSGGIHPGSLEAIRHFRHPRLAGIDLNSGFEAAPGLKDVARLASFLQALRSHT
jgi:phosphoribosylanthranilate isomerase